MNRKQDWALTIIRVAVGIVFLAHGAQKVFVFGHAGVAGMMGHLGIPLPGLSAWAVMAAEFLGGAALVLGAGARLAAAALTINMIVAVLAVHLKGGFFLPAGMEFAFTLMLGNVGLVIGGPGALALDNLLGRDAATRQPVRVAA